MVGFCEGEGGSGKEGKEKGVNNLHFIWIFLKKKIGKKRQ